MNRINNKFSNKKKSKIDRKEENTYNKKSKINSKKRQTREKSEYNKSSKRPIKKKHTILKFFFKLIFLIILILAVLGVLFYNKVQKNGGGVRGALITILGSSEEEINNLETINILLLGVSEDLDNVLTDTIIICSYNPQIQEASIISIPRDTFVGKNKNIAKGTDKINSLYSKNPDRLLDTVSDIVGVEINNYIVINNNALINIVDIIGGIEFDVPIDMDYDDPTQDLHIHLKRGIQKIDGEKAEQLLRFRHNNDGTSYPANYGDNDFGRMKTQRNFIMETIKQTLDIKNIFKAKTIINAVTNNIVTNKDLKELLKYVPTAIGFDINSINSVQLPGSSEKCNNLWFYIYDKKETKKIIENLDIN